MKISIMGVGYVGLANAVLLSQNHEVVCFDIDPIKVSKINKKISPIEDLEIENYLLNKNLNLSATSSEEEAILNSDFSL